MIRIGGEANIVQKGETRSMRMNKLVSAGLVVAEVAVRCVDRKSVSCKKGSSNMLHLEVMTLNVSTISSRLFWCLIPPSDCSFLCPFCFSPVHPVEDSGEYLREYMHRMRMTTSTIGPAQRTM